MSNILRAVKEKEKSRRDFSGTKNEKKLYQELAKLQKKKNNSK